VLYAGSQCFLLILHIGRQVLGKVKRVMRAARNFLIKFFWQNTGFCQETFLFAAHYFDVADSISTSRTGSLKMESVQSAERSI